MSVACDIYLPNDVRLRDVANVMGILAGLPKEKVFLREGATFYVKVPGVIAKSTTIPEMAEITLETLNDFTLIDDSKNHFCGFHYENEDAKYVLLITASTPFWIAIGIGLCKFFGGKIDCDDCDNIDINHTFKKPRPHNNPNDGKTYLKFQKQIWKLKSLGMDDLIAVKNMAAYPNLLVED